MTTPKIAPDENNGAPVATNDTFRIWRQVVGAWTPFKATVGSLLTYMQANLTFPSTSVTPSNPTRALNTIYQNTSGKVLRVAVGVKITPTISLSGGQEGLVTLQSDSGSTPTTGRAWYSNGSTGTLVIGLVLTQPQTGMVSYDVPPGHYYRLATTNVTSTPTFAIVGWTEEVRT